MSVWHHVFSEIKTSDGVVEVVDARCPKETRCLALENMLADLEKPFWVVINKADLVPREFAMKVKNEFKKQSKAVDVVFFSCKTYYGYHLLKRSIEKFFKTKAKLAIFGFPNVGKSSIINALAKRSKAGVAPKPGFTRGKQWIRISSKILISDTPGVLPKSMAKGWRKILFPEDIEEAAYLLLSRIEKAEGTNFKEIYGIEPKANEETLIKIAERFNFKVKGNKPDISRAASKIISDWNAGRLTAWWF